MVFQKFKNLCQHAYEFIASEKSKCIAMLISQAVRPIKSRVSHIVTFPGEMRKARREIQQNVIGNSVMISIGNLGMINGPVSISIKKKFITVLRVVEYC